MRGNDAAESLRAAGIECVNCCSVSAINTITSSLTRLPFLAVTDAPVLTMVSDVVVLVMEAGRVPIKAAQHMREILGRLNAPIAGIVMNDKTGKGEQYSYYGRSYYGKAYGYRGGYGYGYGYYSDEEPQKMRKGKRWENFIPDKLLRNLKKYLPNKRR